MIIHLIGQPGSGKTTIARELEKLIHNSIRIDGDELREIFKNKDYSEEGRRRNLTNAYNIARFLSAKNHVVILAMVSPYEDLREELKSSARVFEIFLNTNQIRGREDFFVKDYAVPQHDYLAVNTDFKLDECIQKIVDYLTNE